MIGHYLEFDGLGDARSVEGGLTLLGGIAGAVLINVRACRVPFPFFQVMDGAEIGLAFGIAFGRIGDLIIGITSASRRAGSSRGKYKGVHAGGLPALPMCRTTLEGARSVLTTTRTTLSRRGGEVSSTGIGVHQTALYDMFFATLLFLILYVISGRPRRLRSSPSARRDLRRDQASSRTS